MSLYNLLHGTNWQAPLLEIMLGIDQESESDVPEWPKNEKGEEWYPYNDGRIPAGERYVQECIKREIWPSGRFRDIYLNADGTKITLYTRNGGGNRESYFWVFDILRKHPNYNRDYDDDFDSTYAYIEFSVPERYKALAGTLSSGIEPKNIAEKFQETIAQMQKMAPEEIKSDKRFSPIVKILEEIISKAKKEQAGKEKDEV